MTKHLLSPEQLRELRKGMYGIYLKELKKGKKNKSEIYEELAKLFYYKNGNVVYHTIRRIENKKKELA